MDLFRARAGRCGRDGRVANSAFRRNARTAHATRCPRHFHHTARSAHAALCRASRGSLGPLALGTRHRSARPRTACSAGLEQYRSVSATSDGRRRGRNGCESGRKSLERAAPGPRGRATRTSKRLQCRRCARSAPRFRGTSMFYLSARGTGDGLWRLQDGQTTEIWKGSDGALREPPAVSPDGSRVVIMVERRARDS